MHISGVVIVNARKFIHNQAYVTPQYPVSLCIIVPISDVLVYKIVPRGGVSVKYAYGTLSIPGWVHCIPKWVVITWIVGPVDLVSDG